MTHVAAKLLIFFALIFSAFATYTVMRALKFTVDQSLIAALVDVVCMVGSWHP